MRLIKRLKTLWYVSGLNLEKESGVMHTIRETLGINRAIVVEDDPIEKALREFK